MKKIDMVEINTRLTELVASFEDDKNELIQQVIENKKRVYALNIFICRYAMYSLFTKKDIKEAKQYFYLSGKLTIYDIVLNNKDLQKLEEEVGFLLLSDNQNLISKFSEVRQSSYDEDIKEFLNFVPCTQAVLRDDWEHLKELNQYSKYNIENKRGWKSYQADLMFFEAFLEKDTEKMTKAILLLATKYHKRRYDMPLYNELISIPALTYAKLAYLKGYKLDIDHPLIPKELLPINPNEEYWDFDFMKEGVYKDV